MKTEGSRAEVMHGKAMRTSGGLTKKELKYNKQGRIVSKKKSQIAKKDKRLEKAGYKTKKGEFGSFYVSPTKKRSKKKGSKKKSR
tara:strand:- start:1880 stop:2134 length:255 start_codon:yes stop_codon:yes gene_type:complete